MKVTGATLGTATLLGLEGRLTVETDTDALHELVRAAAAADGSRIVLDFEHVPRLDCSGIGELVRLHQQVSRSGGALALVNVWPRQKQALQLVELLRVFQVFDTRQEALTWCVGTLRAQDLLGAPSIPVGAGRGSGSSEDLLINAC